MLHQCGLHQCGKSGNMPHPVTFETELDGFWKMENILVGLFSVTTEDRDH